MGGYSAPRNHIFQPRTPEGKQVLNGFNSEVEQTNEDSTVRNMRCQTEDDVKKRFIGSFGGCLKIENQRPFSPFPSSPKEVRDEVCLTVDVRKTNDSCQKQLVVLYVVFLSY